MGLLLFAHRVCGLQLVGELGDERCLLFYVLPLVFLRFLGGFLWAADVYCGQHGYSFRTLGLQFYGCAWWQKSFEL